MTESLSSPEHRESGPEYEADTLVWLNETIQEVRDFAEEAVRGTHQFVPDVAPDVLARYCDALATRDPAFGRLLVRRLSERALVVTGDHIPTDGAVERHVELARSIDDTLIEEGHVQRGWLDEEWAREGKTFPGIETEG